jgi:hypothetical protein
VEDVVEVFDGWIADRDRRSRSGGHISKGAVRRRGECFARSDLEAFEKQDDAKGRANGEKVLYGKVQRRRTFLAGRVAE